MPYFSTKRVSKTSNFKISQSIFFERFLLFSPCRPKLILRVRLTVLAATTNDQSYYYKCCDSPQNYQLQAMFFFGLIGFSEIWKLVDVECSCSLIGLIVSCSSRISTPFTKAFRNLYFASFAYA